MRACTSRRIVRCEMNQPRCTSNPQYRLLLVAKLLETVLVLPTMLNSKHAYNSLCEMFESVRTCPIDDAKTHKQFVRTCPIDDAPHARRGQFLLTTIAVVWWRRINPNKTSYSIFTYGWMIGEKGGATREERERHFEY